MLSILQNRIKSLLEADPWFADVTVLTHRQGDIASEIDQGVGSLGLLTVVLLPTGERDPQDRESRMRLRQDIAVSFIENPTTNASDHHAEDALAPAMLALNDQWNGLGSATNERAKGNRLYVQSYQLMPDDSGLILYNLFLSTHILITPNL